MAKDTAATFQRDVRLEDKIIDATVKCFQRFGIAKTSMDDIAKVAKLSRPTIYRYFASRNHLVIEVLVREIRDHTRLVVPAMRDYPYPPKAIVEGVVFAVSTAREHPYTKIVTSDAGLELMARVPGSHQILLDAMSELWLPSLTRWREAGYIRDDVKLEDLVLWLTFFMYSTLRDGSFMAITLDRVRRMMETMLVPSIFDFKKLKADFPDLK